MYWGGCCIILDLINKQEEFFALAVGDGMSLTATAICSAKVVGYFIGHMTKAFTLTLWHSRGMLITKKRRH